MLSTVHVTIDADGHLTIDVDGTPHPFSDQCGRGDLPAVLDEITTDLGTAVRVEVREHDGTTYSDITTPPPGTDTTPPHDAPRTPPPDALSATPAGLNGAGFHPGEEVAIAYIVCTQTAGADGHAAMQLPPALLTRTGLQMLLIGMTSATIATLEPETGPT